MAKLKFWTFNHPVLDNLPPFKSSKVAELVILVKENAGVEPICQFGSSKEELLYQLLGYVKTRLGKIISTDTRLRNNIDGLVSYLIEWLVTLVEQIEHGKPAGNILNYISKSVRFYCLRYLHTLPAYGPTERCYYSHVTQCNVCLEAIPVSSAASELLENLQGIATTDKEREFIRLRIAGHRSVEIAKQLGISTTEVSRIRKTLERRFNEPD